MAVTGEELSEIGSPTDDNSQTMMLTGESGDSNENYTKLYLFNVQLKTLRYCLRVTRSNSTLLRMKQSQINYGHATLQS